MDRVSKKRLRTITKWHRLDLLLLVLSLAIIFIALRGWYTSFDRPNPGDLHRYSGAIQSVSLIQNRHGRTTSIRFRFEAAGPELRYFAFYPSFELAKGCLVRDAPVTVGVTGPSSDIWELSCRRRSISDIDSMAQAKLKNGRAGLYLAMGFGLISLFWIWRILSGLAIPDRVPRKAKKGQAA